MARINGLALKDHIRESLIFNRRLLTALIITILLMSVLVFRMLYLQILHQEHYSTLSEENRVNILPIPPARGLIYDRNGIVLAQNLPSFSLRLVPEHITDLEHTLAELRSLIAISDEDIERFHKDRKQKRRFEGIPLRFRLDEEEVARISVNQYRLPGVEIHAELARHYPLGNLASHAVGYVGRINERELETLDKSNYAATSHIGKVGVERAYEHLLHGQVGYQQVESNAQGRILHVLERTLPIPGKNLYLNLDIRLQRVAEDALAENSGALVALDPRDGAVLALVSTPTYDPNPFVNGLDRKTFTELRDHPERPLFNRALRGQYPPGSTVKPFLGLAGLELEEIDKHDSLKCRGWYMQPGDSRRYRDWKKQGHAKTDLNKAIVESCDVFFYDLARTLGIDRMHDFLFGFGLGQKTGIDIKGELAGILPSQEWKQRTYRTVWYPGETLITGIGQGFMLTTPLQLANITATLSMYGRRMQPNMLLAIQDTADEEQQLVSPRPVDPVPVGQITHWESIIRAMQQVVDDRHGTAHRLSYRLKFSIAGKTGTAQVFSLKQDEEYIEEEISKKLRDHALFIGFAPVEDPQIAVAVIVENGGHGSSAAAPIVRKVMDEHLLEAKKQ